MVSGPGIGKIARTEQKLRPYYTSLLPSDVTINLFSRGREAFLDRIKEAEIEEPFDPREFGSDLSRELWGTRFQMPLMNAAGMFKDDLDQYYEVVADQGAGGFLAGTFTPKPREGNEFELGRENSWIEKLPFYPSTVKRPAVSLPDSGASINSLGLPNPGFRDGDLVVAEEDEEGKIEFSDFTFETEEGEELTLQDVRERLGYNKSAVEELESIERREGCPIGVSLMGDPALEKSKPEEGRKYAEQIVEGIEAVEDVVDFVEINESCPNTEKETAQEEGLYDRLEYISENYLEHGSVPVVVKFKPDTPVDDVEEIVDKLIEYDFSGVNFGNTSGAYEEKREKISEGEKELYERSKEVTEEGGIGGRPLKQDSLELATRAAEYAEEEHPDNEFAVFRTGGIEGEEDVSKSENNPDGATIPMNQWYTKYWKNFGGDVYRNVAEQYEEA